MIPATNEDWSTVRAELARFVGRRVPASDVDDVVQEVLLRMHRGVGSVREGERVGAWMTQVARGAVADFFRARASESKRREAAAREPSPENALGAPSAEGALQAMAPCMEFLIELLPEPYNEALLLTEIQGLTQADAATRLGVPVSTMKSRVQRGRVRLRALVERCCEVELDVRNAIVDFTPRASDECCG